MLAWAPKILVRGATLRWLLSTKSFKCCWLFLPWTTLCDNRRLLKKNVVEICDLISNNNLRVERLCNDYKINNRYIRNKKWHNSFFMLVNWTRFIKNVIEREPSTQRSTVSVSLFAFYYIVNLVLLDIFIYIYWLILFILLIHEFKF